MSFKQFVQKYFNKRAETTDNHLDETLRTHYYKTTKARALKMLEDLFNESETYSINSISEDHGELSLLKNKGQKAFIIITVIMVKPMRTAIDITYTTETIFPFDFGYSTRQINILYEMFDEELALSDD